jgi:hypothetical protein
MLHFDVDLRVSIHELIETVCHACHQAVGLRRNVIPVPHQRVERSGNIFDRAIFLFRQIEPMMIRQHSVQDGVSTCGMRVLVQLKCTCDLCGVPAEAGDGFLHRIG